jgi:hypothetical protein
MKRRDFLLAPVLTQPKGEWLKPFFYPILTVSGRELSRGWPVQPRPGDAQDHAWHRGLWWGHGRINGVDFWREQGRDKSGRIEREALITPAGLKLGTVRQKLKVTQGGGLRFIDAAITLRAGVELTFGDTDDGGFGIRLREEFREDRGGVVRNAEGKRGTKECWGRPSRWTDYSCALGGVAMFDHPANFRHPTPWHARGYALNSANPFAWRSFDKSVPEGKHVLAAGERMLFRYRVMIYEKPVEVEEQYRAWAR